MTRSSAASRFVPHAIIALIIGMSALGGAGAAVAAPLADGEHDYNSPAFFVRHSWVKFAWVAASPFRNDLTFAEEDGRIARFLALNAQIDVARRTAADPSAASAARDEERGLIAERDRIENSVERIIEGRLTQGIKDAGLTRHIGREVVWPPVSIEFEDPPSVLVESPRTEIRKESESLLRGDLTVERAQAIEAEAERDGETSALVVRIGGIAMYPAIVPPSADYGTLLEHAAHEWMHHYLYFTPLGRRYFDSAQLRTLNETVANMAGRELGARTAERYPIENPPAARIGAAAPPLRQDEEFDFTAEMRGLRRAVDQLLAARRIEEAEELMEERRRFLAEHGYVIRRINQAYFAFHGAYADTPGSIDPIGPKLDALRQESPTLQAFVEAARELTSEQELDAALDTR